MKKMKSTVTLNAILSFTALGLMTAGCGSGSLRSSDALIAPDLPQAEALDATLEHSYPPSGGAWINDLALSESRPKITEDARQILQNIGELLQQGGDFDLARVDQAKLVALLQSLPKIETAPAAARAEAKDAAASALQPEVPPKRKDLVAEAAEIPAGQPELNLSLNKNQTLRILAPSPTSHTMGMKLRSSAEVSRFVIDRGVFSGWNFKGSEGSDTLIFGEQGTIISKRSGGIVDFGVDSAKDRFVFRNRINVARCSEKHGVTCHELNHLQQVVIKNFGPEDEVELQGKTFTVKDLRGDAFVGVPVTRLRVVKIGTN